MSETSKGYTGASNLEAMEAARNYNAYLESLVAGAAGESRTALDFGAGGGEFARRLRARGFAVSCVEPDDALRRRLASNGFEAVADIASIAPGSQHFIYTLNVLEHIEDDKAALAALYERLAPGGVLFVYVPAFQILFGAMDRLVGHHRRYRRAILIQRAAAAGFKIEASGYADPVGFFAALAHKTAGAEDGRIASRSVALFDRYAFPVSRVLHPLTARVLGKNAWLKARRP